MASNPATKGRASALPTFGEVETAGEKVVRLPTASRRQVQQRWNKHTREAAYALRDQWPGQFIWPSVRAKMPEAELINSLEVTPALVMAAAIVAALPPDRQEFVRTLLAVGEVQGRRSMAQARALLDSQRGTVGEQYDLDNALDIIRGER